MKSFLLFSEQIGEEMDQFPVVIPVDWFQQCQGIDVKLKLNDGVVHEFANVTDPFDGVLNNKTASKKVRERVLPPH